MADNENEILDPGELADALFKVRQAISAAQQRERSIKSVLEQRGITSAVGRIASLTKTETSRSNMDQRAVRLAMGADWCDRHSTQSIVTSFKTTLRDEAVAQLVEAAA